MFELNKFNHTQFLCLFMGESIMGNPVYYIVDERIWHNAVVFAIESYRKAPKYTKGVYSFTDEQEAENKANELLDLKQVA